MSRAPGPTWTEATKRKAPHKPFLLLAVLDLVHWGVSGNEKRYHSLGQTGDGRLLQITFTIRTTMIRVISARDMHRKERVIYEQET